MSAQGEAAELLQRVLYTADSGHWRDRAGLCLYALPLIDEIREFLAAPSPAATVAEDVAFAQRWRDDAFEAAATISDRHEQNAVAEDIRALAKRPTETTCNALRLLWGVYHHAFHSMDDSEDDGENRIVMASDAESLDKALDAFEKAFPMAVHGEGNANDLIAALYAHPAPSGLADARVRALRDRFVKLALGYVEDGRWHEDRSDWEHWAEFITVGEELDSALGSGGS